MEVRWATSSCKTLIAVSLTGCAIVEEAITEALLKSIIWADEKCEKSNKKGREIVLKKMNLFIIGLVQAVKYFILVIQS